jgi:hypothetical protein
MPTALGNIDNSSMRQPVLLQEPGDFRGIRQIHRSDRHVAGCRGGIDPDDAGPGQFGEGVKSAEMGGVEVALPERGLLQRQRMTPDIADALGEGDHLGDQHVVPPAILAGVEAVDQASQFTGIRDVFADSIRLDLDGADIQHIGRSGRFQSRYRISTLPTSYPNSPVLKRLWCLSGKN